MTKRDVEMQAYRQKFLAQEAQQKAEDVGYALELLLNDRFRPFHTSTTSDRGKHEFLIGVVKNLPINDISRLVRGGSPTEDRRIILWKTTFESGEVIASAYHDEEFRSSPSKLDGQAPELKALLQEAVRELSTDTSSPDFP